VLPVGVHNAHHTAKRITQTVPPSDLNSVSCEIIIVKIVIMMPNETTRCFARDSPPTWHSLLSHNKVNQPQDVGGQKHKNVCGKLGRSKCPCHDHRVTAFIILPFWYHQRIQSVLIIRYVAIAAYPESTLCVCVCVCAF